MKWSSSANIECQASGEIMRSGVVQAQANLDQEVEIIGDRVFNSGHDVDCLEVAGGIVVPVEGCIERGVQLQPRCDMPAGKSSQIETLEIR